MHVPGKIEAVILLDHVQYVICVGNGNGNNEQDTYVRNIESLYRLKIN